MFKLINATSMISKATKHFVGDLTRDFLMQALFAVAVEEELLSQ